MYPCWFEPAEEPVGENALTHEILIQNERLSILNTSEFSIMPSISLNLEAEEVVAITYA
jgi:hypothetical protein